ncbi:MAG TPA: hypothetical protein VE153_17760 [Myxococcus sp.]|nr:hypothetical protein [Myxococcus sp.]
MATAPRCVSIRSPPRGGPVINLAHTVLRLTTRGDEACPAQDAWFHALQLR